MFEHRSQPLLSRRQFFQRVAQSGGIALALVGGSLLIGMTGYHFLERLNWIDAFLNASMILGGMGPVDVPHSEAGKLFAGCYALYCGLVVILIAGIMLAPGAHRLLHTFHIQNNGR